QACDECGPTQSPASQLSCQRRESRFASLAPSRHGEHRVDEAGCAGAPPTPAHTPPASHSYFISKTQESVSPKRSDMTKTSAKWAFFATIAFTGTDTRHPSG